MTATAINRTIARLYRHGLSSRRVGRRVGLNATTVLARLRRMGIKPRDRSIQRRVGSVSTEGYAKWGHSYVHRIVCEAWHGPPPSAKHVVNHIDADKLNNHPDNLEWVTPAENANHAKEIGLLPRGSNHPTSKLTEDQVRWLRAERARGRSYQSIADELGFVSAAGVRSAAVGRTWTHVE